MASYDMGYGGATSGLDINGMVSQLVAAERKPFDDRLNKLNATNNLKLSGVGTVTTAFNALKTALDNLKKVDSLSARTVGVTAASGEKGIADAVSATVGKATPVGTYKIKVTQLATSHKITSNAGMPQDQTFAAGKLQVKLGSETVDVDIAEGSSLKDVNDLINKAAAKIGVQSNVLTADTDVLGEKQSYLSLGTTKTGSANKITVTAVSGDQDLHNLADGLTGDDPSDAVIEIDGLKNTYSSNQITDILPGLNLNLKKVGESVVTVGTDAAASRSAVQDFVNAYNGALNAIKSVTSYNKETNTPSSLTGDAQMRGAAGDLRNMLSGMLADLAAEGLDAKTLGIETKGYPNPDGTLVFDTAKFDAAMAANPAKIINAFTGENGFAAKMGKTVDNYIGKNGVFTMRTDSMNKQSKDIEKQRAALELRMDAVGNRYKAQFVNLEKIMTDMNTTSSFLGQQLQMPKG